MLAALAITGKFLSDLPMVYLCEARRLTTDDNKHTLLAGTGKHQQS